MSDFGPRFEPLWHIRLAAVTVYFTVGGTLIRMVVFGEQWAPLGPSFAPYAFSVVAAVLRDRRLTVSLPRLAAVSCSIALAHLLVVHGLDLADGCLQFLSRFAAPN
jgi:hypothetical protein